MKQGDFTNTHSHAHMHWHSGNSFIAQKENSEAKSSEGRTKTFSPTQRLLLAFIMTTLIAIAEICGAYLSGSITLAADAGHMIVDSSGIAIALGASYLMRKASSDKYTWGFARAEILSAALQAGMLLVISCIISWESISHIFYPESLQANTMILLGVIGLTANFLALIVISGEKNHNLNMQAAFLEVANDAIGSLAVIIAGIIVFFANWKFADPIAAFVIVLIMVPRAYRLLSGALIILMEATPKSLEVEELKKHFLAIPEVVDVHDLHLSTIQSGVIVLSAHMSVEEEIDAKQYMRVIHSLEECTAKHFPVCINHTTFQIEPAKHWEHESLAH